MVKCKYIEQGRKQGRELYQTYISIQKIKKKNVKNKERFYHY